MQFSGLVWWQIKLCCVYNAKTIKHLILSLKIYKYVIFIKVNGTWHLFAGILLHTLAVGFPWTSAHIPLYQFTFKSFNCKDSKSITWSYRGLFNSQQCGAICCPNISLFFSPMQFSLWFSLSKYHLKICLSMIVQDVGAHSLCTNLQWSWSERSSLDVFR